MSSAAAEVAAGLNEAGPGRGPATGGHRWGCSASEA